MMLFTLCSVLLALSTQLTWAATQDGPLNLTANDSYPYHQKLDNNYDLKWNFNSTHIAFETRVKTNGYIGFGISGSGAMYPADVIVGWVSDGQVHFADRHTMGHSMPVKDTSQDWHLIGGSETGDYTTLTMIRELDTCDSQDMAIKEGTTRVIYSYHPRDPASDDSILYHESRRGTKSVLLLDPPSSLEHHKPLPSDVKTLDFLNRNYTVPGDDTTYSCTLWKLPDLGEKHHMIKYDPVIQPGHEKLVHHIILYYCTIPLSETLLATRYNCYQNPPREARYCQHAFTAWAIGGTGFSYPDHVGHSLGTSSDPVYFRLETHYDNPGLRTDFVDNSGLRLYITKQLREHDAGILQAGVDVNRHQIVPPYNSHFLSQGYCDQVCIGDALKDTEMRVFANILHAHLLGTKLRLRIIRDGVELPPLQEDLNYDFNFQEMRSLPEERIIKKGDALVVDCVYDSSKRTGYTFGGLSTRNEMCLSYLLYYPRSPLNVCLSSLKFSMSPLYNRTDPSYQLDWKSQELQDQYAQILEDAPFYNYCKGDGKSFKSRYILRPKMNITQPYTPPETCTN